MRTLQENKTRPSAVGRGFSPPLTQPLSIGGLKPRPTN